MAALSTKTPSRKAAHLEATQRAKHAQKQRDEQAAQQPQLLQAAKQADKKGGSK